MDAVYRPNMQYNYAKPRKTMQKSRPYMQKICKKYAKNKKTKTLSLTLYAKYAK